MNAQRKYEVFYRALLLLNAAFPTQSDGLPLLEQWIICEEYCPHILALLNAYDKFKGNLGHPILLCEIVRRCAW